MERRVTAEADSRIEGRDRIAAVGTLTLLRHGQSEWNRDGRFTGWSDVGLSEAGVAEAGRAGRLLARGAPPVDCCFTSMLRRATSTSEIVLRECGRRHVPVEEHWRLNERHYGALQGMRVWPAVRRYGPVAVLRCRRGFHVRPPALRETDPRSAANDPRYASLAAADLPHGESVADTQARLLPYWRERIAPEVARGRHVLVVSHKNTLRALLKLLRRATSRDIPPFVIANGAPLVLTFEAHDLWMLGSAGGLAPSPLESGG